ncbi:MAG: hypothetical protein ACRELY_30890 [Polyangiaceae bacterium]
MARARLGDATYAVDLAENAADRRAVFALREAEYRASQSYLLTSPGAPGASHAPNALHCASDPYDARSFVFVCHRTADSGARITPPLATCRFTLPLWGSFELDDLTPSWTRPPVPLDALVETSRVVVQRSARATGIVEAMLLLAGSWLLRETPLRYNFAVCARPLDRLYARLGMRLTSDDELTLRGRPAHRKYVVIYGDMKTSRPSVEARLRARGWEFPDSDESETSMTTMRKAGT